MPNEEATLEFLVMHGLIPPTNGVLCPTPGHGFLKFEQRHNLERYLCYILVPHPRAKWTRSKNSFFEHTHLQTRTVMKLAMCFTEGYSYDQTIKQVSMEDSEVSRRTVADWFIWGFGCSWLQARKGQS